MTRLVWMWVGLLHKHGKIQDTPAIAAGIRSQNLRFKAIACLLMLSAAWVLPAPALSADAQALAAGGQSSNKAAVSGLGGPGSVPGTLGTDRQAKGIDAARVDYVEAYFDFKRQIKENYALAFGFDYNAIYQAASKSLGDDTAAGTTEDAKYATVGGGYRNRASASDATVSGGRVNWAQGWCATVGGGDSNVVEANYATIGGGVDNWAFGEAATVGGGNENWVADAAGTIGGGFQNKAGGSDSTIGGGIGNYTEGNTATVAGGSHNTAYGELSSVGGGLSNYAEGTLATVAGGNDNGAAGYSSTVGGGLSNRATQLCSTVSGGNLNLASTPYGTVGSGDANDATGEYAAVGGGQYNYAQARWATIGRGGPSLPDNPLISCN